MLAGLQQGAQRITAANQQAVALGMQPGMALADARARMPDLAMRPVDASADGRFLLRLAECCVRFTPAIALDPPDGLVLDVTGCAHLFGGEAALHEAACAGLARHGVDVRASLASTPHAARALARFGNTAIAPPGQAEALARTLPIAALGLDAETEIALSRAGLRTLGALADRPGCILSARFGEDLVRRLARTLGREDARIVSLRARPDCLAERHLAEPLIHLDGVHAVLDELIAEVAAVLEARQAGGRLFEASLFRIDGTARRVAVETGRPVRDAAVLQRLYRERLAALADPLDPGFGFDAMRLAVPVVERLDMQQMQLGGGTEQESDVAALLDRLAARLGRDRVLRAVARDTHWPERQVLLVAAQQADAAALAIPWPQPREHAPPDRPILLFDPPQPIEVIAETPDAPPRRFRWRQMPHDVALAEGPERIAPEWWRALPGTPSRDYYRIEDSEGRRFWVFRAGLYERETAAPRWFLHGLFA